MHSGRGFEDQALARSVIPKGCDHPCHLSDLGFGMIFPCFRLI